jgi:hypothetical protein
MTGLQLWMWRTMWMATAKNAWKTFEKLINSI